MKKILLLGGTGAIGTYVIQNCIELGYYIYVTSRSVRKSNDSRVVYIQGNAMNIDFLKSLLYKSNFDAVVDFMNYNVTQFKQRISILTSNTTHYIYMSSYRVYDNLGLTPITESSPRLIDSCTNQKYLSTQEYALSKARQENILSEHKGKNWTIIRPSISYSSGRFQLGNLEANVILPRAMKNIPVILPDELFEKRAALTWAGDVGFMISRLLFQSITYSEIYNIATSENIKWKKIVDIYQNTLKLKVEPVSLKKYKTLLLNPYQLKYDRLFDRVVSSQKILKHLGIENYFWKPLKQGIETEITNTHLLNWENSYTRIHGRIDRILKIKRFNQVFKSNSVFSYLVGYSIIGNSIYYLINRKKYD